MKINIHTLQTENLFFLKKYNNIDKRNFLRYISEQENKATLFEKMMPQLFFYISIDLLFPHIYQIPELEKVIIDYMDKRIIQVKDMSIYTISLLIDHTHYGQQYFFNHIEYFFPKMQNQLDKMMGLIHLYNQMPDFQFTLIRSFLPIIPSSQIPTLLRKVLFLGSIDTFFTEISNINDKEMGLYCIQELEALLNEIVVYSQKNPNLLLQIPIICDKILTFNELNHLPTYLFYYQKEASISKYIETNYDLLFQKATPEDKLSLLQKFTIPDCSKQKNYYQRLLNFLSYFKSEDMLHLLCCSSNIFQPNYLSATENIIQEYASTNPTYLNHGAYATVLNLGKNVLKIGNRKGQENFTPISFFRLIPETYYQAFYSPQQNYDFVIEVQPKIDTTQVSKVMTTERWFQLFWDFYIHHLEIADNTIMNHCTNNLGILTSQKQASHNGKLLPSYFKQMPIVILDQDFIFQRGVSKETYNQKYTEAMYEFLIEYLRSHEIPDYVQHSNEWNEKTKTLKYYGK